MGAASTASGLCSSCPSGNESKRTRLALIRERRSGWQFARLSVGAQRRSVITASAVLGGTGRITVLPLTTCAGNQRGGTDVLQDVGLAPTFTAREISSSVSYGVRMMTRTRIALAQPLRGDRRPDGGG